MPTIIIDGLPYEVGAGKNLLHAALSLGLDLPYFCWHPALGSVGACRLCAVKQFRDGSDTRGRLVMGCLTPASEGALFAINDPDARAFRASVVEWLMANHPHDCPVCDEGGECHLQDMTVMTGHTSRDYRFPKRTYRNQDLGPLINHEMNRCIQCYRCVRFYGDYAGGHDLQAFASRDRVYFGRHENGPLESEFSGNLVEICPTGVFTDKTLKGHYARKWDLQTAPAICVGCALGCNTIPGERYGSLRRIRSRYNDEVNRYFLCDRGRYGYEFVNSERRVRLPLLRHGDARDPASPDEALDQVGAILAESKSVIGIGSPRAALEANFALRALVGPDRFFSGMAAAEDRLVALGLRLLREGPARSPSLSEVEGCDAVLVLGEDVTNSAPLLALALRQSVRRQPMAIPNALGIAPWNDLPVREAMQGERGPLFVATPADGKLDEVATQTYRAAPDDIARLAFAVAHALDSAAPPVADLSDKQRSLVEQIARALADAKQPLVVAGVTLGSAAILQGAANVAWALCNAGRPCTLSLVLPECNSMGVSMLGGHTLDVEALLKDEPPDTIIVLENDLYRRSERASIDRLLDGAQHLLVIDHLENGTSRRADLLLPGATFAEGDGTLVSSEGRAQRFYQVFVPDGEVQESWRWLREMARASGRGIDLPWSTLDDVVAAIAEELPQLAGIVKAAPPADFRVAGAKIPRQRHRFSGRTAMWADITMHEPKPPEDRDSPLSFSMEGLHGEPPPALISEFWSPGWNSAQAINKFQSEVGGPLHGGAPGQRLIAPALSGTVAYFDNVPDAFAPSAGQLLVVPLPHIFGSDELSALSPGIAALAPKPYVALNPSDADERHLHEGDSMTLGNHRLPVKLLPALPRGVAGVGGLQIADCRL